MAERLAPLPGLLPVASSLAPTSLLSLPPSPSLPEGHFSGDPKSNVSVLVSNGHVKSSSSWAEIVRKDCREERMELKFFPSMAGGDESSIISPPSEVVDQGQAFWRFSLVGYFCDSPPHFMAVKAIANKIWARFGLTHSAGNDDGYFFFRFSSQEMLENCLRAGPWTMAGKAIFLKCWKPGMHLNKDDHKRFPIWIKLRNLPIEYWTPVGLSWAASVVGIPLQLDPRTARMENLSFARVCVEVGVEGPFPKRFSIKASHDSDPIEVLVEYSWRPIRCSRCRLLGHDEDHCRSKVAKPPSGISRSKSLISASMVNVPLASTSCHGTVDAVWGHDEDQCRPKAAKAPSVLIQRTSPPHPVAGTKDDVGLSGCCGSRPTIVEALVSQTPPAMPVSSKPVPSSIGWVSLAPLESSGDTPVFGPSLQDSSDLISKDDPDCVDGCPGGQLNELVIGSGSDSDSTPDSIARIIKKHGLGSEIRRAVDFSKEKFLNVEEALALESDSWKPSRSRKRNKPKKSKASP